MRKIINLFVCLVLLAGTGNSVASPSLISIQRAQAGALAVTFASDHLIVRLRPEASVSAGSLTTHIASLDHTLSDLRATGLSPVFGQPDTYRLNLAGRSDITRAVTALKDDPAVEYAEPDYQAHLADAPNDPRYPEQWGLSKIQAEGAWAQTQGSPNIVIAVIDSGIDLAHPDLAANLWVNPGEIPGNGIDDDNNGLVDDAHGWNFVSANNDVQDAIGHGSLVAGVAAARTGNAIGIAGVCGLCRILPIKVTQDSGVVNYSDIAAGVNYAVSKGAQVINLSVGGYSNSQAVQDAVANALSHHVVVVGGAGNDDRSDPFYPAADSGVIAVAGTAPDDTRVPSSNYGAWVTLSAPGQDILSTTLGDYSTVTGTSYAAPFVAGTAGLLLNLHPEWTPAMLRAQLMHSADAIDSLNPGFEGKLGAGRLNASTAMQPPHPILSYQSYAGNGTPNLRPDFGATVNLAVTLYNDWADATGVTGVLSTGDASVTVTTAAASFGDILSGQSTANALPFTFNIAVGAGYSHAMPFTLALSANGGAYTATLDFTITTRSSEEPTSGTIDNDTTWTSDKIYKITGLVGVAPGATLTIQAGTEVMFAGNYALNVGGTLIARGTADHPVRFEPYTAGGSWQRIFFDNPSTDAQASADGVYQSGNVLQYVSVSGASGGIACTNATPFLDHLTTIGGGISCTLGDTPLWVKDSTLVGTLNFTQSGSSPSHLMRDNASGGNVTLPSAQVSDGVFTGALTIQGAGQVSNTTAGSLTVNGVGNIQQVTTSNGGINAGASSTISNSTTRIQRSQVTAMPSAPPPAAAMWSTGPISPVRRSPARDCYCKPARLIMSLSRRATPADCGARPG